MVTFKIWKAICIVTAVPHYCNEKSLTNIEKQKWNYFEKRFQIKF